MNPSDSSQRGVFIDAFSDAATGYAGARPIYPEALFEALAHAAPMRSP